MRLNAVKILKITVTTTSKIHILEEIQKYLDESNSKTQKSLKIFTPNTEQLVLASKNSRFRDILNRADIAIPDTIGVVWAGHILSKNGPEKPIPGVEFMDDLVKLAAYRHVPVGLIGGRDKVAVECLECLQKKYPGLTGWATEDTELHRDARIIFVALGAPKQEYFIEEAAKKTKNVIFMTVGGSFDILSGRLPRAPVYFRRLGLEWFWRLILEPRRIFRQFALVEFMWMVLWAKVFPGYLRSQLRK